MNHNLESYPWNLVMTPNIEWSVEDIAWFKYKIFTQCRKAATGNCILWTGSYTGGYAYIWHKKAGIYIHRLLYELVYGILPEGIIVRHSCDITSCININHLLSGTQLLNAEDRESRNRGNHAKGERNTFSILTKEQVLAIRKDNSYYATIAEKYGISVSGVSKIKNRRTWRHI